MNSSPKVSRIIFHIALVFSFVCIAILLFNQFIPVRSGEPYSGNSYCYNIDDKWTYIHADGTEEIIDLPKVIHIKKNEKIIIERILPDYLHDHLSIYTRSSRQNMRIYVDGEIRSEYLSDNLPFFVNNVPSAFVFADLCSKDANKTVRIELWGSSDFRGNVQSVGIAEPDSAWAVLWKQYGIIVVTNLILFLCGAGAVIMCLILMFFAKIRSKIIHLAYSLIIFSLWALCESRLRQVIFHNSTVVGVLVFIFLAVMVIPLFSYWNEVQKGRYRIFYDIVNGALLLYLVISVLLYIFKVQDIFDSILINYFLIFAGIVLIFVTTIIDLKRGYLREYPFELAGILLVLTAGLLELILSRVIPFYAAGLILSISLIFMLILSSVQGIRDLITGFKEREQHHSETTLRTIRTVAGTIDAKDEYTGGHSVRVAEYASRLAAALGKSDQECRNIHYIGLMHDIGKIGVPDIILNKQGKLVQDEFSLMKLHPTIGCEIIGDIDSVEGLKDGVLYHHERFDGKGYPFGLKGENIPLVARILCLADSYDAMTSARPYRSRLSDEEVKKEIKRCSGLQFDPVLAEVFLTLISERKIRPISTDGFETMNYDKSNTTSLARQKMIQSQKPYSGAYEISNPEFMRMIIYIIKLAERNRKPLTVKLFTIERADGSELVGTDIDEASDFLRAIIVSSIRSTDITTPYSRTKRMVLFFNADSENSVHAIEHINEKCAELDVEKKYAITSEEISLS